MLPADPTTDASSTTEPTTALTPAQCRTLLRERGWGVLSIIDATERPYAVPVTYAFDGEGLYLATGQGRKLRALEQHPTVSFTVLDVERFDRWRSVVVIGAARPLWAGDARLAALRAFIAQKRPAGFELTPNDALKLMRARVFRVEIAEMTGRSQHMGGEWPVTMDRGAVGARDAEDADLGDDLAPEASSGEMPLRDAEAMLAMQGLRRLVHAIVTKNELLDRERGLSSAQLFVLREIGSAPGLSITDLARRTLASQHAVLDVVARLVANGLVDDRVVPGNHNRANLYLSVDGARLSTGSQETVQEQLVSAFRSLAQDDRRLIAGALERWLAAAGLGEVPPTMFFEPLQPPPSGSVQDA